MYLLPYRRRTAHPNARTTPRHVKSASVESANGLTVPSATLRSKRSSLNPVNQQFLADVAAATAAVAVADGGGNGDGGGGGGGVHGEGGGGGSASSSGGAARHDFLLNELVASDGQLGPTLRKLCSAGWALCKMCCSNYFLSVSMKTMKATCKRLNGHPRVSKYHTSVSFFKSVVRVHVCVCVCARFYCSRLSFFILKSYDGSTSLKNILQVLYTMVQVPTA